MSPIAQAILTSWSFDLKMAFGIMAALIVYLRGWLILHRTLPARFTVWRLSAFAGGLAALWIAVSSPLDAFSSLLLSAHMVQHLLLMSVAPPLILLSAPLLPLLRGLPRRIVRDGMGPFLVWPALRRAGQALTNPLSCWIVMAITLTVWHVPAAFDLALRSFGWHKVEHACFFGASFLFWWPVVCPFPSKPQWPQWSIPVYLLAADVMNTALSAFLTFSDHVFYRPYLDAPRLFGTTALSDQACAGLIMWVPGSLVFLIPATFITIQYLSRSDSLIRPGQLKPRPVYVQQPLTPKNPFDLLRVPAIGPFLRAQSGRRILQTSLLIVAVAVIVDGLFGPQVSSMNLAGVLPWTYWRAFVIIALLAAGNFFCMACPFTLFRELGQRFGLRQRPWPQALQSKWFAIALLALFFWAYEVFSLWDKPIWTAWLIINYFLAAFVIDAVFRRGSFCKYVCPIGQFQFVASLVSPLEVKVREADVCASCQTHDCLRGNERQRGCETELHLPRKSGNLDCTFCLDCVRACPHENIGVLVVAPGINLIRDTSRSSIGRLSRRLDIAALALVFVFAGFANAAFMTAPVVAFQDGLAARLGLSSRLPVTHALLVAALVLLPGALAFSAAYGSRVASNASVGMRELFCRFSLSLVPLGVAMWAGHFLFHLSSGWGSAWKVVQRAANDIGWPLLKSQDTETVMPLLGTDVLHALQTVLLDAGLLLGLYLMWRMALLYSNRRQDTLRLLAPWSAISLGLYIVGIWILLQPMQMRGLGGAIS